MCEPAKEPTRQPECVVVVPGTELEYTHGRQLVGRGTRHAVTYLGTEPEDEHDPATTSIIPLTMDGTSAATVGHLRLHDTSPNTFSRRDQSALAAFTKALTFSIRNATAFAQLSKLEEEHRHTGHHDTLHSERIRMSASAGLAFGNDLTDFGQLFHCADTALSQAKHRQWSMAEYVRHLPDKNVLGELPTG